ncbi:hypothetical protein [Haliangium sp.]|uniref:hypothetical protein n=1 Tax=Haliangium sp. TaxID=2663208 RepID=UPI003D118597
MASQPPGKHRKRRRRRRRGISFKLTLAAALVVAAVLLWRGSGYYFLEIDLRPEHPEFRDLRPSGGTGLFYGVIGTVLIFTNLLYLARRRLAGFRHFGSMRTWLDLHVFTGLVGATFIAFHSTFQARALVNQITAVSLIVVIISGLIGRFFYALIPKPDVQPFNDALDDLEEAVPGLREQIAAAVSAHPPEETRGDPALIRTLRALPGWRRTAHERREAVELIMHNAPALAALDPRARRHVKRLSRRLARAAALEAYGVAADAMLRAWRPIHRLFAFIMILTVLTHIGVAWFFGYADIF